MLLGKSTKMRFNLIKLLLIRQNIVVGQGYSMIVPGCRQCRIKTLEALVHSEKWGPLSIFWNS